MSKSSLLQKIKVQNTQTLQLFSINIFSEIIYKRYEKCQAVELGFGRSRICNKNGVGAQRFKTMYLQINMLKYDADQEITNLQELMNSLISVFHQYANIHLYFV
jgi:hypothetical protein